MKKLTAKQRAKIYREAAEYFATANWENGCPGFCEYLTKRNFDNYLFPEIEMFSYRSDSDIYFLDAFDPLKDYCFTRLYVPNHNQRVMCLLLAEQIALRT